MLRRILPIEHQTPQAGPPKPLIGRLDCSLPALACCLVLAMLTACHRGPDQGRVIILGIDGLDPYTIDLLMSEGQLPNFARLRQDGAYGKLLADPPLLSPVLWTTIATGKTPDVHGIGHFVAAASENGDKLPVTSAMRRVKAVWNIASEAGREVATVGWWATWPPEPVNGWVVSDHTCYHFLFHEGLTGGSQSTITFPPELAGEIAGLVRRPGEVDFEEASRYVDVEPQAIQKQFDFADEVSHFRWALATADSYRDIGLELWHRRQPDLLMVYIEGTDSISHLWGHLFRAEGLAGELAEQQRRYGRAVEEVYRYADQLLGRYLEAVDSNTTLLVMSDHGFKLGELHGDPSKARDMRRVTELQHRPHGILYMYGNRVTSNSAINEATQLDITPTVLNLLGLAVAGDMPGRVLTEALGESEPPEQVASYEDGGGDSPTMATDSAVNQEILAHLQSLGYVDSGDSVSPKSDRNIAAIHFQAGHYQQAAEIYSRLIEQNPTDGSLYTSLAGCLGAMGRYEDALAPLAKGIELNPVNVEVYHNRAVVNERLGNRPAAIADYQTALRYNPQYEPSRAALLRLTGTTEVRVPSSAAQDKAAELAELASVAARRGAYAKALRYLAEAEQVAPDYVLVYQYQANVAYLMNDLELAEKALRKGLKLEPDNALFRANLDRVLASKANADP